MTEQPSGTGPDNPAGKLQPLNFQQVADDGHAALYEALVKDQDAPGSPVFAVTLTIASSVQRSSPKELHMLLSGMRAVFTVLPELPPDNGEPGDDEPFNVSAQILIELSVARSDGTGPVNVGVTVETATGIVPLPSKIVKFLPHSLGAGLADYWKANSNQSFTATVRPTKGKGTIRPPRTPLTHITTGNTYKRTAREVIVEADSNQALDYSMTGSFHLERSGVRGP
jgi:hypothetical protein